MCGDACVPNLAVHLHDMHGPRGAHPEVGREKQVCVWEGCQAGRGVQRVRCLSGEELWLEGWVPPTPPKEQRMGKGRNGGESWWAWGGGLEKRWRSKRGCLRKAAAGP